MERSQRVGLVVVAIILAAMSISVTPLSAQVRYTVTDLSAILNDSFAQPENVARWSARAINDHGQIAGYAETTDSSTFAFVWDEVNGLYDFSSSGQATRTFGINNLGQVAITGPTEYFWDRNTGLQEIVGWGSGPIVATGINDLGMVVGSHWPDNDMSHAFLWQNGVMQDIGNLGAETAEAWALNNQGQVVGWSETADSAHAFLWDSENGMWDLGSLGMGSAATDINNVGQVVGYSGTGTQGQHAFLWEAGGMVSIDTLGGETSVATSVNDRGDIVGSWQLPEYGGSSAYLWTTTDDAIDLNTLIDSAGVWRIVGASGINDNGWIVGTAVKDLGTGFPEARAVLLRPVPEPTIFILLVGGIGTAFAICRIPHIQKRR